MWPSISHSATSWHNLGNNLIPCLFGGIAGMLVLVALSLLILACKGRKSSSTNSEPNDIEKAPKLSTSVSPDEMEPRIVVIMAGDHMPTCLAEPVSGMCQTRATSTNSIPTVLMSSTLQSTSSSNNLGGIAGMLVLVALSLLILACNRRKSSTNSEPNDIEKAPKLSTSVSPDEIEPRIVVIMAGDHMPTCLAEPVSH